MQSKEGFFQPEKRVGNQQLNFNEAKFLEEMKKIIPNLPDETYQELLDLRRVHAKALASTVTPQSTSSLENKRAYGAQQSSNYYVTDKYVPEAGKAKLAALLGKNKGDSLKEQSKDEDSIPQKNFGM
jgi:hypothetical protein